MQQQRQTGQLPGRNESCWVAGAPSTRYEKLHGEIMCDVVIVGAGIVGLTAALRLCERGVRPLVLEGRRVGRQVTGLSSAKITAQHALVYRHLIGRFGEELARFYADANRAAMAQMSSWIGDLGIACGYEPKSAYCYCNDAANAGALEEEAEAARSVGFDARVLERAPLPFDTAGALEFPDQAQFNPASYLVGLAQAVEAAGGCIREESRARGIEAGDRWEIETDDGEVHARNVVVATNLTVKTPRGFATRTRPRCHTCMAFGIEDAGAIDGVFLSIDEPARSIRTGEGPDGPLMLVLGPHFQTGHEGDVAARFVELEAWARENLPVGEARWRWCNEDYDTEDRMPFVGEPDPDGSPGFHVATGFNAWGISNGTAAGMMIAEQIATGSHPWGPLFDPARPVPKGFNKGGDTQSRVASADAIAPGQGGVLEKDGEDLAVWRDETGALHALSAKCTHKGCTLTWNNADRTWDCPCHGSVFTMEGAVFHGPAREPLEKRDI